MANDKKRINLDSISLSVNPSSNEDIFKKIPLPEEQFPAASFSAWSEIVNAAGIPSIPSKVVDELHVESLLRFDEIIDREGNINPEMEFAHTQLMRLKEINKSLEADNMLRWDVCAPLGIKLFMAREQDAGLLHLGSKKRVLKELIPMEDRYLQIDDPRAFDILFEHLKPTVKIIKRPLVEPMKIEGYPAEFRVFIKDNEVLGVSNYYPQMSMPNKDYLVAYAEQSKVYAEKIIEACHKEKAFPVNHKKHIGNNDYLPMEQVTATLDFMVTEGGILTFIEAGPSYGFGAHPCCFFDPDTNNVSPIEGIKLGIKAEPIPFAVADMDADKEDDHGPSC